MIIIIVQDIVAKDVEVIFEFVERLIYIPILIVLFFSKSAHSFSISFHNPFISCLSSFLNSLYFIAIVQFFLKVSSILLVDSFVVVDKFETLL